MGQLVLQTKGLSKRYQNAYALQDVTLTLEAGRIYGLIGQNGAGKTTLMRLIAGLAFPDGGSLELFGRKNPGEIQQERGRMGVLIENPALIPHMSARENLRYYRILRGIPNREVEAELLKLTGLGETGKKKAKHFSLGMKQRLGIAIALLSRPELLILDEPVNGLDPVGVVEIRRLLQKLCDERRMTILISSHNLPELYQTATDYLIIHQGRLKQVLTQEQLEEACRHHLLIACDQPEKLAVMLEKELHTTRYQVLSDGAVRLYDYLDAQEKVSKAMLKYGLAVTSLSRQGESLEDYFLAVIGGGSHG